MKTVRTFTAFSMVVACLCLMQCSKDNPDPEPVNKLALDTLFFEHAMKGWELYSWPNGNDWNYSILAGTNRTKSYNEVIKNRIVVTGIDSLKLLLDRFAEGEDILWIGEGWLERCWSSDHGDLSLPDIITISEVQAYCAMKNLTLNISN